MALRDNLALPGIESIKGRVGERASLPDPPHRLSQKNPSDGRKAAATSAPTDGQNRDFVYLDGYRFASHFSLQSVRQPHLDLLADLAARFRRAPGCGGSAVGNSGSWLDCFFGRWNWVVRILRGARSDALEFKLEVYRQTAGGYWNASVRLVRRAAASQGPPRQRQTGDVPGVNNGPTKHFA